MQLDKLLLNFEIKPFLIGQICGELSRHGYQQRQMPKNNKNKPRTRPFLFVLWESVYRYFNNHLALSSMSQSFRSWVFSAELLLTAEWKFLLLMLKRCCTNMLRVNSYNELFVGPVWLCLCMNVVRHVLQLILFIFADYVIKAFTFAF